MTTRNIQTLSAMIPGLAIFVALVMCGCGVPEDDPWCHEIGSGATVCLVEDHEQRREFDYATVSLGVQSFLDIYTLEWSEEDLLETMENTTIYWGRIEKDKRCPCGAHGGLGCEEVAGCCQDIDYYHHNAWVKTIWWSETLRKWMPDSPCETALIHELIHAAEQHIEHLLDYEHDDYPHRWGGHYLKKTADHLWCSRLGDLEDD